MSHLKSTEPGGECEAKYKPQKNSSITISPSHLKNIQASNQIRCVARKRERRKHKNSFSDDDMDDDFTVTTGGKKRKRNYIRTCIKKRLHNNYEKQINCLQDETVMFTDNKIYVSLAARSSLTSVETLKKNRRVIYPTSFSTSKSSGFLRDYDFNYESPTKQKPGETFEDVGDGLKFNIINENSMSSPLDKVVFEKVKIQTSKTSLSLNDKDARSFMQAVNEDEVGLQKRVGWNHSFNIKSYEADPDEDDQWKQFLEIRKHEKLRKNNTMKCSKSFPLSDSGFGSQFLSNSSFETSKITSIENDDNSFNEELEMYENSHHAHGSCYHTNDAIIHENKEKYS